MDKAEVYYNDGEIIKTILVEFSRCEVMPGSITFTKGTNNHIVAAFSLANIIGFVVLP